MAIGQIVALPPQEKVIKRRLKKKDLARRGERAGAAGGGAGAVAKESAEDTSPSANTKVPEALKEGSHAAAEQVTTASDGTPLGVGEGKAEVAVAAGGEANLGA